MEENNNNEVVTNDNSFNGGLNKKERNLVWIAIGLVLTLVTFTLCEYAYNEFFQKSSTADKTNVVDDTVEPTNNTSRKITKYYQGEKKTELTTRTEKLYLFDNNVFILYDTFSEGSVQSFYGKYTLESNKLTLNIIYKGGSGCGYTKVDEKVNLTIDNNGSVSSYIGEFLLSAQTNIEAAENELSLQGGCTENIDEAKALYDLGIDVTYTNEDGTEYLYSGSKQTITKKAVNNNANAQTYNIINKYMNELDNQSYIEFYADGTFKANQNQCQGYSLIEGTYKVNGSEIDIDTNVLNPDAEGLQIIGNDNTDVTRIKDIGGGIYNCSSSDTFVLKK